MFKKRPSPAKKKFAAVVPAKGRRRPLDPRTRLLIKQAGIGLGLSLLVLLVGCALWYGTRVTALTITTVTATGGETISTAVVIAAVEDKLKGEYIGLVPRRFAWAYPEEEILASLSTIARLKNPQLRRVGGTELKVEFEEYFPHALWCTDRGGKECYFIDDTGYAFSPAPQLQGGALARFMTIGTAPEVGVQMIPPADLEAIEVLRTEVSRDLSLPIAYVETDIMRDIFMGVAGGGEIKATLRLTPQETFENLRAVLSAPEFSDLAPGNFQYIDLRFGNKVFVNEETKLVATSTLATSSESTVLEEIN